MKHRPFTVISPYYDVLMSDVDYEDWVEYVARLCPAYRERNLRILDMAGGTGVCALLYDKAGHDVVLLDSSPQMLEVAAKRFAGESVEIEILNADMRDFHVDEKFDMVTCLFDSINNLASEGELESCFRCVAESLKASGLFVFDMNTEYGLSTFWGDKTLVREDEGVLSIWQNRWNAQRRVAVLNLTLFIKEGDLYRRLEEVHEEKGFPIRAVVSRLEKAGFTDVYAFKHLTTDKPTRFTGRVMFRARRE